MHGGQHIGVFSFTDDQVSSTLGNSSQSNYLRRYLSYLKAETVVIEDEYVDKDYLIDYANFYSRAFDGPDRFTTRLHFFTSKFDNDEFDSIFTNDETFIAHLQQSYLGFIVVKPISKPNQDNTSEPLIGRTLLKTYPPKEDDDQRIFIGDEYLVSLYGIPLRIKSLPFQAQDTAVAACATTALWIALHPLSTLFGVEKQSPFEITQTSVSFPHLERNFPSTGLNLFQMKTYFNAIGLETEIINVRGMDDDVAGQIISNAIKAYLKYCGLPIVAGITIVDGNNDEGLHASVISGYRQDALGQLKKIYVHDDQVGPYSRTCPKNEGNFSHWDNEWTRNYGYNDVIVETLMIPTYSKIRLRFSYIYEEFMRIQRELVPHLNNDLFNVGFFLIDINSYKHMVLQHDFDGKKEILMKSYPKYLWVIRLNFENLPIFDLIYDATSVNISQIGIIPYENVGDN